MNWKTLVGVGILVAFLIIGYGVYQSITTLTESATETMGAVTVGINQTATQAQETMEAAQAGLNATTQEVTKTIHEVQETVNKTEQTIEEKTTPPKIYDVNVVTTETSATITWKTDKESECAVRITKPIPRPLQTVLGIRGGTEFSLTKKALTPGTDYSYEIIARSGVEKTTYTGEFTTEKLIERFDRPKLFG